ncbi:MAG: hypothetical protein Q4A75_02490 [Peptostreptococcaceae bacterium]|nr:hypothetical protein [Peptostreptococcaceae bacterium]
MLEILSQDRSPNTFAYEVYRKECLGHSNIIGVEQDAHVLCERIGSKIEHYTLKLLLKTFVVGKLTAKVFFVVGVRDLTKRSKMNIRNLLLKCGECGKWSVWDCTDGAVWIDKYHLGKDEKGVSSERIFMI